MPGNRTKGLGIGMNSPSQLISNARMQLERDATRLAGGLTDLSQRATVYHHLYEDSGKNHIFPLIAAHGALWAGGYFRFGMRLGQLCSLQFGFNSKKRRDALDALNSFADAFRDINRRVCIDTYVSYHLTKRFGNAYQLKEFLRPPILNALALVHDARENNRALTTQERKYVFKAHFLNEQDTIVGPAITAALEQFSWPIMKKASLSPVIRFAYLPRKQALGRTDFL